MSPRTAVVACSLALAALVGLAFAPASYDDGYITYRYADNLAHGRGFVFNPSESVLGTSAPGYGLVLGGLAILLRPLGIGVDVVGASLFLAGFALLPILLFGIFRRLDGHRPELVAMGFALLALPARWNVELMGCEQVPILVLVALAILLALERRELAAGVCAGLAAALRFDAGLAVAALALAIWIERRRIPWRFSLAASLPVAFCWIWLLTTFGTILPLTLAGKRSEMGLASTSYGMAEFHWLVRSFGLAGTGAVAALALWGLVGVGRLRGRARLFTFAAAGWLLAHELFYRLVGVPFAPWYHVATVNALLVLATVGACRLLPKEGVGPLPLASRRILIQLVLAVALFGAAIFGAADFLRTAYGRPPDPRTRIYQDVAAELRKISPPLARVATVEIGTLAFFADRPIVDLVGLFDPALRSAREEHRLAVALAAASPDYLVDNPAFHGNFLAEIVASGDLDNRYRLLQTFSRPEYPYPVRLLERIQAPSH